MPAKDPWRWCSEWTSHSIRWIEISSLKHVMTLKWLIQARGKEIVEQHQNGRLQLVFSLLREHPNRKPFYLRRSRPQVYQSSLFSFFSFSFPSIINRQIMTIWNKVQGPPLNRELVNRSLLLIVQNLLSTKPLRSKLPLVNRSDLRIIVQSFNASSTSIYALST